MANEAIKPVFASASVPSNGSSVAVLFTEAGSPPILPATGVTGFTVKVDGVTRTISSATASNLTVTLNLATPVQDNQVVTVSYTGGNVTDSADVPNTLLAFAAQSVTNNSTVPDVTAPDGPTNLAVSATMKVVLTWDEVPTQAYKVYRDGEELSDVAAGTFTYTDDSLPINNLPHVYRISAVDGSGNETKSSSIRIVIGENPGNKGTLSLNIGEANSVFYEVNGILRTPTDDKA